MANPLFSCDDGVDELTEAFDFGGHGFTWAEPALRRAAKANACRRAGTDDIAGHERGDGGDPGDEIGGFEDELPGVRVLKHFAADGEPDVEVVGVGDFVGGDDGGAEGAEGVEALCHGPLGGGELDIAGADVVEDGVAEDVVMPVFFRDAAAGLSDDDRELNLVIGLLGERRDADGLFGSDDGGWEFGKDGGEFGELHFGFDGVVAVVEANAEDAGWRRDGGEEAGLSSGSCGVLTLIAGS